MMTKRSEKQMLANTSTFLGVLKVKMQ